MSRKMITAKRRHEQAIGFGNLSPALIASTEPRGVRELPDIVSGMDDDEADYDTREAARAAGHRVDTAISLGYARHVCLTCRVDWPCAYYAQASETEDETDANSPWPGPRP